MTLEIRRAFHLFFEKNTVLGKDLKTLHEDLKTVTSTKEVFIAIGSLGLTGTIYFFSASTLWPLLISAAIASLSYLAIKRFGKKQDEMLDAIVQKANKPVVIVAPDSQNVKDPTPKTPTKEERLRSAPQSFTPAETVTPPPSPHKPARGAWLLQRQQTFSKLEGFTAELTPPKAESPAPKHLSEGHASVRKKLERQFSSRQASETEEQEHMIVGVQQSAFQECIKEIQDKKSSATPSFCDFVNAHSKFALDEARRLKQKGEFPGDVPFLLGCLPNLNAHGIFTLLSLIKETQGAPAPTEPLLFASLCELFQDKEYRGILFDKSKILLEWLFKDSKYQYEHVEQLIEIFYCDEMNNHDVKTQSAFMQRVYTEFRSKPTLVKDFIAKAKTQHIHYLLAWVVNAEIAEQKGFDSGENFFPCLQPAFNEIYKKQTEPKEFLNLYFLGQGELQNLQATSFNEFKLKVICLVILDVIKKRKTPSPHQMPLTHARLFGLMPILFEEAHVKLLGSNQIVGVMKELLDQAAQEGDPVLIRVFDKLLEIFCNGDENRSMKDAVYTPLKEYFFNYFKSSTTLQMWGYNLNTANTRENSLRRYLEKAFGKKLEKVKK